jgi:hypothetical protein
MELSLRTSTPRGKRCERRPSRRRENQWARRDTEFTDLRAAYEARARNREVGFALKNELHQVSLSGPVRAKKRLMRRSKRRRYSITC